MPELERLRINICDFADMNEINWIQYTIVILTIMFLFVCLLGAQLFRPTGELFIHLDASPL